MNREVPIRIKWLVMTTFIPFRDHTDNRHIRVKSRAFSKNYNRTAIIQEHTRYNTSAMLQKIPCFDVSNALTKLLILAPPRSKRTAFNESSSSRHVLFRLRQVQLCSFMRYLIYSAPLSPQLFQGTCRFKKNKKNESMETVSSAEIP